MNTDNRFAFNVEWFDQAASLVRPYLLTFFQKDSTIEMYDIRNKRTFLKRSEYPGLALKDIFIGAILNIHSRKLKVTDYADQFTRQQLSSQKGKTCALIKPDAYLKIGQIISLIEANNFTISNIKMVRMSKSQAQSFLADDKSKPYFREAAQHLSSDVVVALQLIADNSVAKLLDLIGPIDPAQAKRQKPRSIRAQLGSNIVSNAIHGSQSIQSAMRQLQFIFSSKSTLSTTACFSNCACLIIKPSAISALNVGQILDRVLQAGFEVSALQMFWLDRPSAEQFLQVYKGVVPEYNKLVDQLINGGCIAAEIRQQDPVPKLRELCGPHDPEMARSVRPKSLRAIYGQDKGRNAVHCTDLADDAILQVEYFFNILQNK